MFVSPSGDQPFKPCDARLVIAEPWLEDIMLHLRNQVFFAATQH
jgi:hypothetical protein